MGWRDTLEGLYKNRDWKAATEAERKAAVTDVIRVSSFGAAAVSVTPVPLADVVMAMPLQAAMVVAIGYVKGRDISRTESFRIARELSTVVGTHMLARQAFVALSRIIFPGMAGFLLAPWTFGVTWAMGRVAEMYFDDPDAPAEKLKAAFKDALDDAKKAFSKEAFLDFMKRAGKEAQDFAHAEKDTGAASTPPAPPPPDKSGPPPRVVEAEWEDVPPKPRGSP
ncbi:MAG: DUF697 domain-containing protein [Deltaproteobacteria bacterium]|nr:DUF697 domain-containing protein [Deltaproteobacteria bacterium]